MPDDLAPLMKKILVIHGGDEANETSNLSFRGREAEVRRLGCGGSAKRARELIADSDGVVDSIGLEGLPIHLELGRARLGHGLGATLAQTAEATPVVDGGGIRSGLERWGVILADRAEPGIFSQKRILMLPGVNHNGLAHALGRHSPHIRYADPEIFFGLPDMPVLGSRWTLDQVAQPTLERLRDVPFEKIQPLPEPTARTPVAARCAWADVLAGDAWTIRRFAPAKLKRKTVVVPWAREEDLEDFRRRGVSIVVTLMPSLDEGDDLGRWSPAAIEALFVALRQDPDAPLSEDTYLDLMADLEWQPAIRYLQPQEAGINRFAFVIHPLDISFIHKHPAFRWTRFLPDDLVERVAAYLPPMYISRITGGESPTTGQRIEGHLISLAATPRQMMRHGERFTYKRLNRAARMAERKGARLMGLGAFTSVVGDAGATVAHEANIAITSGNSLTVAATLEAAKQAAGYMGLTDLRQGRAMVIGATGSIGSVCSRLLAQATGDVVLVSIEPEKLIDLKRTIERETPGSTITIATQPGDLAADCDLIVTATSAFGQRILDVSACKPGAVICDVARPPDVGPREAALRPDVAVIESGEVLIPGDIDFGYNIGLPPKTAYACLAETALLAMEGHFESYTIGRDIEMQRVKEIQRLFDKHEFRIAGLRSYGRYLTDEDFARKRALAEDLLSDTEHLESVRRDTAARLAAIPIAAKGVKASGRNTAKWAVFAGGAGLLGLAFLRRRRNSRRRWS